MKIILFFVLMFVHQSLLSKELVTIYNSGKTKSITTYLERHKMEVENSATSNAKKQSPISFPVKTDNLTSGKIESSYKPLPQVQMPVFLIGDDSYSRCWLKQHRNELLKLNALGLLVDVETEENYRVIVGIGQGLPIVPMSGADIASNLGIKHYPVLISQQGIEQ